MIVIDVFETMLIIDAAWLDGTALKSSVLEKAVNVWFHQLTPYQRGQINTYLQQTKVKSNQAVFTKNQQLLLNRFNPEKQFIVHAGSGEYEAFQYKNDFHTHANVSINPKMIIKVEPNPDLIKI